MGRDDLLDKSDGWILRATFELAWLQIPGRRELCIGDFYGDPACGVIDANKKWCVVGGCGLIVYRIQPPFREYDYDVICDQWSEFGRDLGDAWWVSHLEQVDAKHVRFTVDEVDKHSGIYELNVDSMAVRRLSE